jgi:hypothetical protein
MPFNRMLAAVGAVSVLAGVLPAVASAGGGGGTLVYPSIVNERLVRAQASLDHASDFADDHQPDRAAAQLLAARKNVRKAWVAAKYVIDNAPPPVAGDDRPAAVFHRAAFTTSGRLRLAKPASRGKARAAGGGGPAAATIYDTAFAVLSLQHRMATLSVGLIDDAHSTLLSSVSTSEFTALNGRDDAIAYIHSIDTPAPPVDDKDGPPVAQAADDPAPTWGTVMPALTGLIDDELQQLNGTLADPALRAGARRVLGDAVAQNTKTETTVNTYWPPLPADD